jgi:hypothetical protein
MGNLISAQICPGETYTFNGQALTTAGTYTASFDVGADCDSVVTLLLSVGSVNTNVVQAGNTLTALAALGPYQWVDCNNAFAEVPGANNQSFTPTQAGSYAVVVTSGACSDTSACYSVAVGIEEQNGLITSLSPNPATNDLRIDFDHPQVSTLIEVWDVQGRMLLSERRSGKGLVLDISAWPTGVFQLRLTGRESSGTARFVKE